MAAKDDLDLGEDKQSTKKWIIILVATLVLLIGVAAGLYFTGMLSFGKSPDTSAQEKAAKETRIGDKTLYFYEFEPFLVNFPRDEIARLLQINFSVMTYDEKTMKALGKHAPMIRNNLLLLLGGYKPEDLQSVQGKEALRQAIAQEIQKVLDRQTEGGTFEAVFFTHFVMQ